jgi:hypothetical protein
LLEAVTRKRLAKSLQDVKELACAVVIFELWKSAIVLQLLVVRPVSG